MASTREYSLLIVDDEERICFILHDLFKSRGYKVRVALNGYLALAMIAADPPDMVISDIHMPGIDGFELFGLIRQQYAGIKHVLMTSYNVDQYIASVRKFNVGNILVKGADFSLQEVMSYISSLLSGNIFGLNKYYPASAVIHRYTITNYRQSKELCEQIADEVRDQSALYLQIALDELISNAVFHGVLQLTGVPREYWHDDYEIDPRDAISITWAKDHEKIGISVEDPKGNLKKMDVLHWLSTSETESRGEEEHGRGFILIRKIIDRFIVNIDPGKRTECIILQYFDREHVHTDKPLLIHEL